MILITIPLEFKFKFKSDYRNITFFITIKSSNYKVITILLTVFLTETYLVSLKELVSWWLGLFLSM